MAKILKALRKNNAGASAAEYALILAVLGGVIIAALTAFGADLKTAFTNAGSNLTTGK